MVKRDELIAEGHATAARIVREAEAQQRSELNRLEQEKAVVEHRIQELKSFEREYRAKLKRYIESQLTDLDTAGVAPTQAPGYTPGLSL
jgi:CRISPR/Cas system-associated endonuclease Cas1